MNDRVKVKIRWNDGKKDTLFAVTNWDGKDVDEDSWDDTEVFYSFEPDEEVLGKHMEFEVLKVTKMERVFFADFGSTTITESELDRLKTREDCEQWKANAISYVDVDTNVFSHWEEVSDE